MVQPTAKRRIIGAAILVVLVAIALAWRAGALPFGGTRPPQNSIHVIAP